MSAASLFDYLEKSNARRELYNSGKLTVENGKLTGLINVHGSFHSLLFTFHFPFSIFNFSLINEPHTAVSQADSDRVLLY